MTCFDFVGVKQFRFNNIFCGPISNECMVPLLNAFLTGENGSVIAHGPTGIGIICEIF